MKQELKKITNLTINELLNNEIILPSTYFNKFNYHAKELEINLDDEDFKKELNSIILEDLQTIENYMNLIVSSATALKENTQNAKNAIINKDVETLGEIYKKMLELENEVKSLNGKLFLDDLTSTFNKKWVYNKFLNTEASFQQNGICVLIDVVDYTYIQKEYGELLSNNLLIFATKFIKQKLKDEDLDFKIVRYYENKFLVFIIDSNENKKEVINSILNLEHILSNTTLKSNSGLFIKAKYKFKISSYKTNQESKEIFERLLSKEQEE
ncbi:MAG: diguanylate cyclase [Aliarcobacter sp.]|nr:diguanylate cyclase [Aliarcobacter sp.]